MGQERRRTPRYPINAAAEVVDDLAGKRFLTHVSEISLHGCYLDVANPLPHGICISLRILKGSEFIEVRATVVHSQANRGVGIMFHDMKSYFQMILKAWLLEAEQQERAHNS